MTPIVSCIYTYYNIIIRYCSTNYNLQVFSSVRFEPGLTSSYLIFMLMMVEINRYQNRERANIYKHDIFSTLRSNLV